MKLEESKYDYITVHITSMTGLCLVKYQLYYGLTYDRYDMDMFDLIQATFRCLPLCTLVNNKVLVLHGGLFARDNVTIDDIQR